ncbi:MAG TPA: hypothetical protein VG097_05735 [Gemmata sp.]|jgi:hypothetical protein|nr:hypothetical protein [Gemmata sp.]
MPELVLTEDQAKQLAGAFARVIVKDQAGKVLGHMEPALSPEFVAELKRRAAAPGPRYSGLHLQARLAALQTEWERTGGFDAEHMKAFLDQLEQSEPEKYGPKRAS